MATNHVPVLLRETLEFLSPRKGETVIDCTLGLGGHAEGFADRIGRRGKLIGIDADEENLREGKQRVQGLQGLQGNFRDIASFDLPSCDILFADLGVSSPHLDDPERGFSFRAEGPLDCRYDQTRGQTASELIVDLSVEQLGRIFSEYGEVERARPLARAVKEKEPRTTNDLVCVAEEVYGFRAKKVLPQIFQTLRIAVNDEMGALTSLLEYGPSLLKSGGRFGIISYHSLEDRMVKQRFRALSRGGASYQLLTPKAIQPKMEEIDTNPRARSARLRAICKL